MVAGDQADMTYPLKAMAGRANDRRVVITVPHASNSLPDWIRLTGGASRWNGLSTQHWAYDRGAAALALAIAASLEATVIQGDVSRLAIDLNRDLADHSIIPESLPNVGRLDFNTSITTPDLSARWLLHARFHARIEERLSAAASTEQSAFLIDLHSFDRFGPTESYREVDIGICCPAVSEFCRALLDSLRGHTRQRGAHEPVDVVAGAVNVRLDEPYSADHPGAYVTRRHSGPKVHGVVIEVCDELLATADNVQAVASLLCSAIQAAVIRVDKASVVNA